MIGYDDLSLQYGSYKLTMHDQLRELARHIAREEYRVFPICNPLRLSSSNDIEEMLQSQVCVFALFYYFILLWLKR
jgi:hypothetical protein